MQLVFLILFVQEFPFSRLFYLLIFRTYKLSVCIIYVSVILDVIVFFKYSLNSANNNND